MVTGDGTSPLGRERDTLSTTLDALPQSRVLGLAEPSKFTITDVKVGAALPNWSGVTNLPESHW